jgi:cytochrome P450 PksS
VLFTRWPKLRLAIEPSEIHWNRRPGLRSIAKLPVAV